MILPWDDPSRAVRNMSLEGGRPCLDLLNTLRPAVPAGSTHVENPKDLLLDYEDLLALAVRTVVLPSDEADALQARADRESDAAVGALEKARDLRALLRRIIMKVLRKEAPSARDLASFEALRSAARSLEVLVWEDGRFRLRPRYLSEVFDAPVLAFVRDADEFLRSSALVRVRVVRINTPDTLFTLG